MEKPGRNDQCPCGSGLKYKRCHGSMIDPKISSSSLSLNATEAVVSLTGFPGQHQQFHQMFRSKPGDPRNELPVMGVPGNYEVIFVLKRPGYAILPEYQISFSSGHSGDSHLAISKPAFSPPGDANADQVLIYANNVDGHFEFIGTPNKRGFLGKLTSKPFRALNRTNAEEIAYRAVAPALSEFSMCLDIPLEVAQTETKDLLTHNVHISFVVPYTEVPLAINPTSILNPEYRGFASLYREAMNSNSPVFQFLCLFKISEGLRARRVRSEREAKRKGALFSSPIELLPNTHAEIRTWLNGLFYVGKEWDLMALDSAVPADLRGREFRAVLDEILNPLRRDVAHALFEGAGGELNISSDELLHTQQITKRLPLIKCIVRRMLKNDFPSNFLSHLPD